MAIGERIPPPAFVDPEAPNEGGLDLLGLRLPVQGVGLRLLDGDEESGSLWIHWPDRPDRTKDRVKMRLSVSRHASVAQAALVGH